MNDKKLMKILDDLHHGNTETSYQNAAFLNSIATELLAHDKFSANDISRLEILMKICNILYNDTDSELLPIEDGVYDLLMEKWKSLSNDFQVGADVLEFRNNQNQKNEPIAVQKEGPKEVLFFDEELDRRLNESLFLKDILFANPRINAQDVLMEPNPTDGTYIEKRSHNTSHHHPELVGTLDKCKFVTCKEAMDHGVLRDQNVKILERDFFAAHIEKGIIDPLKEYEMVCELKYDGVSVEADCTDHIISARSRGDTGIGQASDMTPIFAGYQFPHVPKSLSDATPIGIKFEAIIQKCDLDEFNAIRGYNYKNGRTAIVGLVGSSDAYKYRDLITLVPLQSDNETFLNEEIKGDRVAELEFLNEFYATHGCPNRYVLIRGNYIQLLYQIKAFLEEAEFARSYIPFMYDGIVVSYVDQDIRNALGRENYINKYSMAVKFNPMKKQTTFRGYTYTVGQDGSVTPMIHYDPVEFYGTVHPKSSGQSYANFKKLDLAVGDIIDVDYVNDVMPYVTKPYNAWNYGGNKNPKEVFPTTCPVCGGRLEISQSGKSVKCVNPNCGGRGLSRMVNMFSKLNMNGFGEATIAALGKNHLWEILEINKNQEFQKYGFGDGEAKALSEQLDMLNNIPDYIFFGSLGFDNIAYKTWQVIFSFVDCKLFMECMDNVVRSNYDAQSTSYARLMFGNMKGLGPVTIDTIIREYEFFKPDIDYVMKNYNIISPRYGYIKEKVIRATGFRNRELFQKLRDMGYDADDNGGVTKKTDILLVPYDGYSEGNKIKKAPPTCQIVPIQDFLDNMDKYLK